MYLTGSELKIPKIIKGQYLVELQLILEKFFFIRVEDPVNFWTGYFPDPDTFSFDRILTGSGSFSKELKYIPVHKTHYFEVGS